MSDRGRRPEEPNLFDLPLDPPPEDAREPTEEGTPAAPETGSELPLFEEQAPPQPQRVRRREALDLVPAEPPAPTEAADEGEPGLSEIADRAVSDSPSPASLGQRWAAGLVDVALHAVLAGLLMFGAWLLGAPVGRDNLLAIGLFLFVFSFLYTVYPLAFWGQTPGMIRLGIVARSDRHGALTFGQTALRWVGGWLTLATLGLGSLLALIGGRSLTDRVSGTRTWRQPR